LLFKTIDIAKFYLSGVLPFQAAWLQHLALGFVLIIVLIKRPKGILEEKSTYTLLKSRIDFPESKAAPKRSLLHQLGRKRM
jgi:hypothetical protein